MLNSSYKEVKFNTEHDRDIPTLDSSFYLVAVVSINSFVTPLPL